MKKSIWSSVFVVVLTIGLVLSLSLTVQAKMAWKMALGDAPGAAQWEVGKTFADKLAEYSNGEVEVQLFPTSQLGSEQETVQNCRLGTLDLSVVAINNVTPFAPKVGLFTLPYMMLSAEQARTLAEGPIGEELVESTVKAAGVRIIAWSYSGYRVLSNSKRPIKKVEDLKGLTIRVPKNNIMISTYKAWGINPTPMAWDEVFTALQQKVIDGQDTPLITQYFMKFYEVQKYVTKIRYLFLLEPLIISEKLFRKQKPEMQEMILKAGKEASARSFQFLIEKEDEIEELFKKEGMEITEAADNEKEWIELATKEVWPKFYKSIGGKEKLDAALKAIGR
ncbi:MAG: TRAP transporter substrate-binding protein [Desulfobacterales bacterium]|jgi:tripartite ATP-independent transporter DctP family solute receptor